AERVAAAPAVPPFYCERSHTNRARSYQHRGLYVDGDGAVFRFQHGRGDQALLRVPADSMTEQALLARFAPGRAPVDRVPAAEMARRYAQVLEARAGTQSPRQRRGADMGATVRRCFVPDEGGIYREVPLRQTGDWESRNTAPAAAELSAWLDSLAMRAP
ncbi:hypothetical protein, partial [Longimicrobium sp.]|uniref:hypothetical protein n=1 Tax=Longimicrobium sp. TaxID=2029185 RepID=UPI002E33F398